MNWVKTGISGSVGLIDEVVEAMDEKAGRTEPFKKYGDFFRLLAAGAGYAIQIFMPRRDAIGEALALSATPLLVKSIAKPLRTRLLKESTTWQPRRQAVEPSAQDVRALPEFKRVKIT